MLNRGRVAQIVAQKKKKVFFSVVVQVFIDLWAADDLRVKTSGPLWRLLSCLLVEMKFGKNPLQVFLF